MNKNDLSHRYRMIWRWHFYAGLFCIPFILILSITGTIYLYKPQFEAWVDRDVNQLPNIGDRASPTKQVEAAIEAVPGKFQAFELASTDSGADRVDVRDGSKTIRAYVHPTTLEIIRTVSLNDRFMNVVKKIHGEMMIGDVGSCLVELAACWTLVMVLTGVYLWWPRKTGRMAGVLYPRLLSGGKVFWRDLHSVVGIWISLGIVLLIVTGLPWASVWGEYFRWGRHQLGLVAGPQDWTTRSPTNHSEHQGSPSTNPSSPDSADGALDRIVAAVKRFDLQPPVVIQPPSGNGKYWTAKSMTQNRPYRESISLDGATGEVIRHEVFEQKHWLDQAVGYGIALHEGQLFGLANQLLATFTTLGLVGLSITGLVLWLRRRPAGKLGPPEQFQKPYLSTGLVVVISILGVAMPVFGASLLLILAGEFAWSRRRKGSPME